MDRPEAERPPNGASFWHDETISFVWTLADRWAPVVKLDLYIGRDSEKPWRALQAKRSWDLRHGSLWTSYNDTPERLGLDPRATYYWCVAQEKRGGGMAPSEVSTLHVKGQRLQGRLHLVVRVPTFLAQGTPLRATIDLYNSSEDALRLYFPSPRHFGIAVRRLRLLGADEHVWSAPIATSSVRDVVEIGARKSLRETVLWPQVDASGRTVAAGEYFLDVRCNADDFPVQASEGFIIQR
jgi:hypothetical protein